MDLLTRQRRSWNMGRIRGANTKPELVVRSLLHREGFRFRLHQRVLPGKPDIVLKKYCAVVFVHGCFWHRHPGCKYAYTPKSRVQFWESKFAANVRRDATVLDQLRADGWRPFVVWECEIGDGTLFKRLARNIRSDPPSRRHRARPPRNPLRVPKNLT